MKFNNNVEVTLPTQSPKMVPIMDMVGGQIGVTKSGKVYYRTLSHAACLTNPGSSYSHNADKIDDLVEILPVGTVVSITVTK